MESIINSNSIKKYAPSRNEMDENIICFNTIMKDTKIRRPSKSITVIGSKSTPISNTDAMLLGYVAGNINGGSGGGLVKW